MLVLDNCEHLIARRGRRRGGAVDGVRHADGDRDQPRAPGCGGRDTVAGSEAVGSRTGPARTPEELREFEAVRLFVDRASKANPSFTFSAENAPDIAEVCARLDGIPLAIELAAARVRMLSVRQIRDGLSDRFQLLTGGARTAVPRHQTLRASVDWSVDLLGDGERRLLARLSVFAGGFTLDAARGVATGGIVGEDEVLDLLTGLVDRSLVQTHDDPWVMRYHLLETIREHAAEQLLTAGEVDAIRDRHAAFFLELAETAEPLLEGRDQIQWTAVLEHERANLRMPRSTGRPPETTARPRSDWSPPSAGSSSSAGHLREAKQFFDVALDTPGASTATRARALQACSYLGWHRLEDAEALAMAKKRLSSPAK